MDVASSARSRVFSQHLILQRILFFCKEELQARCLAVHSTWFIASASHLWNRLNLRISPYMRNAGITPFLPVDPNHQTLLKAKKIAMKYIRTLEVKDHSCEEYNCSSLSLHGEETRLAAIRIHIGEVKRGKPPDPCLLVNRLQSEKIVLLPLITLALHQHYDLPTMDASAIFPPRKLVCMMVPPWYGPGVCKVYKNLPETVKEIVIHHWSKMSRSKYESWNGEWTKWMRRNSWGPRKLYSHYVNMIISLPTTHPTSASTSDNSHPAPLASSISGRTYTFVGTDNIDPEFMNLMHGTKEEVQDKFERGVRRLVKEKLTEQGRSGEVQGYLKRIRFMNKAQYVQEGDWEGEFTWDEYLYNASPRSRQPSVVVSGAPNASRATRSAKGKERAVEADQDLDIPSVVVKNGRLIVEHMSDSEDGEGTEVEDDQMDELDYENERQRRIKENQSLLLSLGIASTMASSSSSHLNMLTPSTSKIKRQKTIMPVYDRSGHILTLPREGEVHKMACVEMPRHRKIKKHIADGEYTDCSHWAEGERRRWRFGRGRSKLEKGEEDFVGGVGESFRWRKWKGLEKELRRELKKRGQMNDDDQEGVEVEVEYVGNAAESGFHYSMLTGPTCHQCRRKSDKEKMICRNLDPECRATFCSTCCKRYSYFDFDPESRTFICPLCKGCCNCANCIRKRNLVHLLDGKRGLNISKLNPGADIKTSSFGRLLDGGPTMQDLLEQAISGRVGVPFDVVRLVNEEEDIISPEIEEEEIHEGIVAQQAKKKKKMTKNGIKERKSSKKGKKKNRMQGIDGEEVDGSGGSRHPSLVVRLKMPKAEGHGESRKRQKEIDSDGDTVGGYSSDEGDQSDMTSISSRSSTPVPKRLPFPPRRPPIDDNAYLSSIVNAPNGYMPSGLDQALKDLEHYGTSPSPLNSPAQDTVNKLDGGTTLASPRDDNIPSPGSCSRTKKRRRPPPDATIVRAPRYSRSSDAQIAALPQSPQIQPAEIPLSHPDTARTCSPSPGPPHLESTDMIYPSVPVSAMPTSIPPSYLSPLNSGATNINGFSTSPSTGVHSFSDTYAQSSFYSAPWISSALHDHPPPYSHSPGSSSNYLRLPDTTLPHQPYTISSFSNGGQMLSRSGSAQSLASMHSSNGHLYRPGESSLVNIGLRDELKMNGVVNGRLNLNLKLPDGSTTEERGIQSTKSH